MTNSWDEMKKAKEDSYFEKKNNEALARLANKREGKPRLSPITGEPMEQIVIHGVVVDRCPSSMGIWLDAGELEQLMGTDSHESSGQNFLTEFFKGLTGRGSKSAI